MIADFIGEYESHFALASEIFGTLARLVLGKSPLNIGRDTGVEVVVLQPDHIEIPYRFSCRVNGMMSLLFQLL
jgi:hypothetical protein